MAWVLGLHLPLGILGSENLYHGYRQLCLGVFIKASTNLRESVKITGCKCCPLLLGEENKVGFEIKMKIYLYVAADADADANANINVNAEGRENVHERFIPYLTLPYFIYLTLLYGANF